MSTLRIAQNSEIARPKTTPLASSILDHATVVEISSFGLRNNAGLWPSYNCLDTLIPTPACPDPLLTEAGGFKTFASAPWIPAFEFAVYGGVQCSAVGLDVADQKSEIERIFTASEGKGVEFALAANRFVTTDSDAPVQWDGAVDLGVVAPPANSAAAALAMLEGYAAAHYSGTPTIHMPRAVASLLNERIVWEGGKAYTRNGSKVAMGGGYDLGVDVTVGMWDMYVTGEVYVEKSTMVRVQSYVLPGDGSGTGSDENGLADNTVVALAERMYRVGVDCFVAKAGVKGW